MSTAREDTQRMKDVDQEVEILSLRLEWLEKEMQYTGDHTKKGLKRMRKAYAKLDIELWLRRSEQKALEEAFSYLQKGGQ